MGKSKLVNILKSLVFIILTTPKSNFSEIIYCPLKTKEFVLCSKDPSQLVALLMVQRTGKLRHLELYFLCCGHDNYFKSLLNPTRWGYCIVEGSQGLVLLIDAHSSFKVIASSLLRLKPEIFKRF